tara:strand:+ start:8986 stop:9105 length:120 start_codon:yes stop_codon:yes gene_type:complete
MLLGHLVVSLRFDFDVLGAKTVDADKEALRISWALSFMG